MNKKVLLSFLSFTLVLGLTACGTKNKDNSNLAEESAGGVISGSVKDLMKSGRAIKCTFSSNEDGVKMSGATYISKNKVRNDSSYTMDGREFGSHMVIDGDYTYYWDSGQGSSGKGTKMNTGKSENNLGGANLLSDEDFDDELSEMEEMMEMDSEDDNFDCQAWKVDNKLFTIPADIEFEDYDKMMEEMTKQIREDNERFNKGEPTEPIEATEAMCEVCDMAPDPAGCRATLNCK